MRRVVVLDIVGLTPAHLGADTPNLARLAADGFSAPLDTVFPAVTCPVQATFTTGLLPRDHGVVANGWYFRDLSEVWLWRQSNRLVHGPRPWDELKRADPSFTSANLFWWFAMSGTWDTVVTPRPAYFADGKKAPDVWTEPAELKPALNAKLGAFPLFEFWGPRAGIRSSEWIASAALEVMAMKRPTLSLVYLPHLDYDLQRFGPADPRVRAEVRAIDAVAGRLIERARADGAAVVALSEYGITAVTGAVHVNRVLREAGLLRVQDNQVGELLEPGMSRAFAVADHQVAHVYVRDPRDLPIVKALLEKTEGIERVLDAEGKRAAGIDHERSGELVAVAARDFWFTYYWWKDDARAPDFARTVDIHRKPGYDPVELFLDPKLPLAKLRVAARLLQKALGFRYLLDVIGLDASIVKGSHGRLPDRDDDGPVFLCSEKRLARDRVRATDVRGIVEDLVRGG